MKHPPRHIPIESDCNGCTASLKISAKQEKAAANENLVAIGGGGIKGAVFLGEIVQHVQLIAQFIGGGGRHCIDHQIVETGSIGKNIDGAAGGLQGDGGIDSGKGGAGRQRTPNQAAIGGTCGGKGTDRGHGSKPGQGGRDDLSRQRQYSP